MTTVPTHWVAGTGEIIPVIILSTGTGGHTPKYVPPDPVVVLSIEDHVEFVASEGRLLTDRSEAIVEAKRLKEDYRRELRLALARAELKERVGKAGSSSMPPPISVNDCSSPPAPVVDVPIESIASSTQAEDVVPKKSIPVEDSTKPQTLLERVIYVMGRDTLNFADICTRLQHFKWMPKRRSSVSNVLSANKNLFLCPEKGGAYSLRTKPKSNSVNWDLEVEATEGAEVAEAAEVAEESATEEDLSQALEAISDDEDEDEESSEGDEVSDEVSEETPTSEFAVWMNKPMLELNPNHSHHRDDDVVLSERRSGDGTWTSEIYVTGFELWFEGTSPDRAQARVDAEQSLRNRIQNVGRIVEELEV